MLRFILTMTTHYKNPLTLSVVGAKYSPMMVYHLAAPKPAKLPTYGKLERHGDLGQLLYGILFSIVVTNKQLNTENVPPEVGQHSE